MFESEVVLLICREHLSFFIVLFSHFFAGLNVGNLEAL